MITHTCPLKISSVRSEACSSILSLSMRCFTDTSPQASEATALVLYRIWKSSSSVKFTTDTRIEYRRTGPLCHGKYHY
ncbi:hypothetical protein M514_13365 [Trichuris suis]|uniref:Uncharacterized protein n=1 Tax=Trichuris suis TaxID=68888 RepID=A0A085LLB3_9BILA|nr:hypothetical protein M513_13365 [Trichuris suis]KFD67157.1 hypothetical protein M514_13365 [Trichuris suis]